MSRCFKDVRARQIKVEIKSVSVAFRVKRAVLKLPIKLRWKFKRDGREDGSDEC